MVTPPSNHAPYLELLSEVVGDECGEGGEERGQEHTHIPDLYGDIDGMEHVIQHRRRHHQTCTSRDNHMTKHKDSQRG